MSKGQSAGVQDQKNVEKTLQKENKILRMEVKRMDQKMKHLESELTKSNMLKDRLENLCRELQKQNKIIKTESSAKLQEAHDRGKELAVEVQSNMGFMQNINDNLATITSESLRVKQENEELASKIEILKGHYDQREEIIQSALKETNASYLAAQTELSELRLKNAEEKEKIYTEMQQLANALVKSREQMKEAKDTEMQLRELLRSYEQKFNGLQSSLKQTNAAYESFKGQMGKVSKRTQALEEDTMKWRSRWEETNAALVKVQGNNKKMEGEIIKSNEGLIKMTELCRALQAERKQMLKELKGGNTIGKENKNPEILYVGSPTKSEPGGSSPVPPSSQNGDINLE